MALAEILMRVLGQSGVAKMLEKEATEAVQGEVNKRHCAGYCRALTKGIDALLYAKGVTLATRLQVATAVAEIARGALLQMADALLAYVTEAAQVAAAREAGADETEAKGGRDKAQGALRDAARAALKAVGGD